MSTLVLPLVAAFVIIGSFPCKSDDCTLKRISDCTNDNRNDNGCPFHDRIKLCINSFLSSCQYSEKDVAERSILLSNLNRQECPGLADGECYSNSIDDCMEEIRFGDVLKHDGVVNQQACDTIRDNGAAAEQCLRNLLPKCRGFRSLSTINYNINTLVNETAICGN